MSYKKTVLKNGLRIITVPLKDNPTVTAMVLVEAGSEYESKDKSGISHFLEHMCFKGTENRTQKEISFELDSIGASNNAFTGNEYTGYYAKSDYRHVNKILDIVSDIYLNPIFPEAEIKKEQGVVIEEINMYEDSPQSRVGEALDELAFPDQPAGRPVAGTKATVRAIKRNDLIEYRDAHYVPEATVVVVAGNFNENEIIKAIKTKFQKLTPKKKRLKYKAKVVKDGPKIQIKFHKGEQTHLALGFHSFDTYDKRAPIVSVLKTILGGGMSSVLHQKMREELGICYYAQAFKGHARDYGGFGVTAGVNNKRVVEAVEAIMSELKKLTIEKVSDKDISKAKEYIIGHTFMGLESSNSYANYYGFQELYQEKIESPEEYLKKIKKVTAQDVLKVAKEIFQSKNLNLALVGPTKDKKSLQKLLTF
jgi:predicted Zn-dependent peptidase